MKKILFSAFIWTSGTILTIALWFAMLGCSMIFFFDRQRRIANSMCFWWADSIIAYNPFWTVNAYGLENIDYKRT